MTNYPNVATSAGNNPHIPKEQIATNVKGSVKWFHRIRGFGFVTRDDTKEDVFVHYSSLKPTSINLRTKRRLNLMDKEKVQFDVVKTKDGLEAINVVGKNGYLIIDIIAHKRDIPPYNLEIINDARVTGKVKWYNVKIKYGFIHCDYNNEDVFVHSSAIVKNNPNKYKPSLNDGEPVEFDILKRADGKLEAVNVSGPNGTSVQGSRYSPDKTEDTTNKSYVEKTIVGKVKWFNVKAGFGFINRNDNGQDVYAHYSSIVNKNPNHRVRSLADGELVQFNLIEGSKGAEATDITGINGVPVQGSEYARPNNDSKNRSSTSAGGGNGSRRADISGSNTRSNGGSRTRQSTRGPNSSYSGPNASYGGRNPRNRSQNSQSNNGKPFSRRNNLPPGASANSYNSGSRVPGGAPNAFIPNQYNNANTNDYNYNQGRNFNSGNNYDNQNPRGAPIPAPYQQPNHMRPNQFYDNSYANQGFEPQNGFYNPQQRLPPPPQSQQYNPANQFSNMPNRLAGTVKWYNFKNGFGFITRSDNNQDVFVHRSGIQANNGMSGLDDGEPVEFNLFNDGNQVLAINVTGPHGANLRGSKYASGGASIHNAAGNANTNNGSNVPPAKVFRRRKAPIN